MQPASILGWSIVLGYGCSSVLFIFGFEHNAGIIVSGLGIIFFGAVLTLLAAGILYLIAQMLDGVERAATDSEISEAVPAAASMSDSLLFEGDLEKLNKVEIDVMWRKLYGYARHEISEELKLNQESIAILEENIERKLNVRSFDELFNIFLILGYFGQAPHVIEERRPDFLRAPLTGTNFQRSGRVSKR